MSKHIGLFSKNIQFLYENSYMGYVATIKQLQYILDADEVYKNLCGAKDEEVLHKFTAIWKNWKYLLDNKSWRKAKIVENILYEIVKYSKNEKDYLLSYIDKPRFKGE